jgi:hypothetical protein
MSLRGARRSNLDLLAPDCFALLAMAFSLVIARFYVMYGRPPLGKENLAVLASGLERSCIRPVCCSRLTAGRDGYRGSGSEHCGALLRRDDEGGVSRSRS